MSSPEPLARGTSEHPFLAYRLPAIRRRLADCGWRSDLVASVNNFWRWDQAFPKPIVTTLRPFVQGLEIIAQRTGRGCGDPASSSWRPVSTARGCG